MSDPNWLREVVADIRGGGWGLGGLVLGGWGRGGAVFRRLVGRAAVRRRESWGEVRVGIGKDARARARGGWATRGCTLVVSLATSTGRRTSDVQRPLLHASMAAPVPLDFAPEQLAAAVPPGASADLWTACTWRCPGRVADGRTLRRSPRRSGTPPSRVSAKTDRRVAVTARNVSGTAVGRALTQRAGRRGSSGQQRGRSLSGGASAEADDQRSGQAGGRRNVG